jgi:hypothetical protein
MRYRDIQSWVRGLSLHRQQDSAACRLGGFLTWLFAAAVPAVPACVPAGLPACLTAETTTSNAHVSINLTRPQANGLFVCLFNSPAYQLGACMWLLHPLQHFTPLKHAYTVAACIVSSL